MASIAFISRSFLLFVALSSVACVKNTETAQNYTIVKTEVDEVQRVAGQLLAESNRLLDEEFSGDLADREVWEEARERREWENVLYLPHLESLNEKQAEAIAENASWVYLNGLKNISPDVAQIFFSKGYTYTYVSLNGLEEISPEIAVHMRNVSRHVLPGNSLVLNGLKEITPEIADILMGEEGGGNVHLGGVTSISEEVVHIISRVQPDIRERVVRFHMPNLQLSPDLAKSLPIATFFSVVEKEEALSGDLIEMIAQRDVKYIYLDRIKDIEPTQVSAILRQERDTISLDGITKLKRGVAKELARVSPKYVSLDGLESLSEEEIEIFIHSDIEELSLKGLNPKDYRRLRKAFRTSDRSLSLQDK